MTLMENKKLVSFREALLNISNSSGTAWLYLPRDRNWSLDSECAILESEEVPPELADDPNAGVPEFARQNGLMQVLPVTVVQDIVMNARMQKALPTVDDYLKAVLYYYKHDAFIDLTS